MNIDQATVLSIVQSTFEEMTFLDVGTVQKNTENREMGPILFLPYSHPRAGSISLNMPKEIKFLSAENIYGESWKALSSSQIDDSLLEMLNVLAGRLLTSHFGESRSYVMGLPTVLFDEPSFESNYEHAEFEYQVDNIRFTLTWVEEKS